MADGSFKMLRVAEETRELRGHQPHELAARFGITSLGRSEQSFEARGGQDFQPLASPAEEFAMALDQLDPCEPERQAASPLELLIS
jgi:hypothetical protein